MQDPDARVFPLVFLGSYLAGIVAMGAILATQGLLYGATQRLAELPFLMAMMAVVGFLPAAVSYLAACVILFRFRWWGFVPSIVMGMAVILAAWNLVPMLALLDGYGPIRLWTPQLPREFGQAVFMFGPGAVAGGIHWFLVKRIRGDGL